MRKPFGIVDIGATKLACLIAETLPEGHIQHLGQAVHAADGIKNGEISDLRAFSTALGKAVESAEKNAGIEIKTIHIVSSFGSPVLSHHHHNIQLGDQAISKKDVGRLRHRYQPLDEDEHRTILQTIEHDFTLDNHISVETPIGMFARHLGIRYAHLSMQRASWMNMVSAAHINHLEIGEYHHAASMAGLSCLNEDMRQAGTLVLDFGGAATSLAIYDKGYLQHASTVKMGGNHITRDIAKILGLSLSEAERVKALDGSALPSLAAIPIQNAAHFPIKGDNFVQASLTQPLPAQPQTAISAEQYQLLPCIIISRLDEIMELVEQRLRTDNIGALNQYHLAVTGGGSQLTGLSDYLSEKYKKTIFMRPPEGMNGLEGQISGGTFAAALGMTDFIARPQDTHPDVIQTASPHADKGRFRLPGKLGRWLETHL